MRDAELTRVETLDTADGGQVLFRPEPRVGWLVVRRLPDGRRCPVVRWDAGSRLEVEMRVATVWGLDRR